jgi:hypothetical protein
MLDRLRASARKEATLNFRPPRNLALLGVMAAVVLFSGCGLINGVLKNAVPLAGVKLQFMCIPEGTPVDTPAGSRPIETLRAGELVIGFSGQPVRILQKHEYAEDPGRGEFKTVEFLSGERVDLCGMHRIDGVRACDLHPGDPIAGRVVTEITPYRGVERSYDLLTEDAGYRIDGLPVNSMIEEMVEATR